MRQYFFVLSLAILSAAAAVRAETLTLSVTPPPSPAVNTYSKCTDGGYGTSADPEGYCSVTGSRSDSATNETVATRFSNPVTCRILCYPVYAVNTDARAGCGGGQTLINNYCRTNFGLYLAYGSTACEGKSCQISTVAEDECRKAYPTGSAAANAACQSYLPAAASTLTASRSAYSGSCCTTPTVATPTPSPIIVPTVTPAQKCVQSFCGGYDSTEKHDWKMFCNSAQLGTNVDTAVNMTCSDACTSTQARCTGTSNAISIMQK